jgi:MoaA/NifB/PqqE/SkfB family radical SAM enzyme
MTFEYKVDNIEWEITTACNAACPMCPRNYYGSDTWKNLPIVQIDLDWAMKHLSKDFIQSIKKIDFCGTYGDPIMNNYLVPIIQYIKTLNNNLEIIIKTNGGIRSADWWEALAKILGPKDSVVFGIDGLEDTNHIYRRNVPFDKVIANAKAFINAGGRAYWSYIVFKHNQHEVNAAIEKSKDLGFQDIIIKKTWRFLDKNHEFQEKYPVYGPDGSIEYHLELPTNNHYLNENYQKIHFIKNKFQKISQYFKSTTITCHHKLIKKIFISAEGLVFPCGWLHDRLYGFEAEQHGDHFRLHQMLESCGGIRSINLNYTEIDNILHGDFFRVLQESWENSNRLDRCSMLCGEEINGIGIQNEWNPLRTPIN